VRTLAAALTVVLGSSVASAAPAPRLDLTAFFAGKTHAENVLKVALHRPVPLIVDSVGGKGDKGDFVLIETIHEGDKPARTRKWVMREAGAGHYTGALTDATSPVDIAVSGDRATIQYVMKGGLKVRQEMRLQGSGRTLSNHVVVRKFGLKFASVDGTIRKLD
jgi:hypothetical protein